MIRRRCLKCGGRRFRLRPAEGGSGRAGALWCAECGRHSAPLRLSEIALLRDGVAPPQALRFLRQCGAGGGGWVAATAERWAEAALERGVPFAPPIESAADLIRALEVATTLPRARGTRIARRLSYAIGADRGGAESWAGVQISYQIEVIHES